MPNAVRIAAIRHRFRKPPAHPELALRLPQQQLAGVGRLIAAIEINFKFLTPGRWKGEGKQSSVRHGGCGAAMIHDAVRLNTDLRRELLFSRHSRRCNFYRPA
jgi:hypothetical protein